MPHASWPARQRGTRPDAFNATTGEGDAGGEFPAGPSLHKTRLDRAALIEAISCGLPGT